MNTVFDIGANVGQLTALFLKLGADRVIALEPQSQCAASLRSRFRGDRRVEVLQLLVGPRPGAGFINICDQDNQFSTASLTQWSGSRAGAGKSWTRWEEVPMVTVQNLVTAFGNPGYIKIDVEGFEDQVLRGMKTKTKLLSFEFHRDLHSHALNNIRLLEALGYSEFGIVDGEITALEPDRHLWLPKTEFISSLFSKHQDSWGNILCR